ncbi:MAG: hypothetical protein HWD61_09455 [Parachlamydiaceae bacterium]|nr:MAG: hypothetical protein HWD61_09455 [Parachlamydiaceae bacterium]
MMLALKVSDVAQRGIQYLTQGKAKVVWADEHFVYYTPVKGPLVITRFLKEAEIKEEVKTTKRLKDHIFANSLTELIGQVLIGNEEKSSEIAIKLFNYYGTRENF